MPKPQAKRRPETQVVSSAPDVQWRLLELEKKLLAGQRPRTVEGWAAKEWGLSRRQVHRYVMALRRIWAIESMRDDRLAARGEAAAKLQDLYRRALNRRHPTKHHIRNPDLKTAHLVLRTWMEFHGLFDDDRAAGDSEQDQRFVDAFCEPTPGSLPTPPTEQ